MMNKNPAYKLGKILGEGTHSKFFECFDIDSQRAYLCEVITRIQGHPYEKYYNGEEQF